MADEKRKSVVIANLGVSPGAINEAIEAGYIDPVVLEPGSLEDVLRRAQKVAGAMGTTGIVDAPAEDIADLNTSRRTAASEAQQPPQNQ